MMDRRRRAGFQQWSARTKTVTARARLRKGEQCHGGEPGEVPPAVHRWRWVDPAQGETGDDINPATGKTIAKVAVAAEQDVERAVTAAQKAYDDVWFDTPPKERSAMLLKLADAIDADADELARLESIDVGKPITVSKADIPFVSDSLRFLQELPAAKKASQPVSTRGGSPP